MGRDTAVRARRWRPALIVLSGALTGLAGCAEGPTDFADMTMLPAPSQQHPPRLSLDEARATEAGLSATAASRLPGRRDDGISNAAALSLLRQQQAEEARRLMDETRELRIERAGECRGPQADPADCPEPGAPATQ